MLGVVLTAVLQQASPGGDDSWRTWVPVASAIVAVVALLVALSNRATARRALALSQQQEDRRSARLDLSLIGGLSWRRRSEGDRWIGMHVLAVNPTDRDGAIVTADLHVTYTTAAGATMVVRVPHTGGAALPDGINGLEIPARLPSNGAVAGWLLVKLDDGLVGDGSIDRYDAMVTDSRGPVEMVQAWVLREVTDGEAS